MTELRSHDSQAWCLMPLQNLRNVCSEIGGYVEKDGLQLMKETHQLFDSFSFCIMLVTCDPPMNVQDYCSVFRYNRILSIFIIFSLKNIKNVAQVPSVVHQLQSDSDLSWIKYRYTGRR